MIYYNIKIEMETENQKYYLTKEGLEEIEKEYKELRKIRIAKTKEEAPNIWESEDLNPDYVSFKEDLDHLENRLNELENIIKNAQIIKKPSGEKAQTVDLGATIDLQIDGEKDEFTLVGTIEANPDLGRISNESPVGKALMGHKIGDEVEVSSPVKTIYKIKNIRYN
jgi:transcription elongation factor GreA